MADTPSDNNDADTGTANRARANLRFVRSRLIDLAVVMFGVSVLAFLMIRLIPGDAVAIMLGANTEVTPERIAELRARLGLDQPHTRAISGLDRRRADRRSRRLAVDAAGPLQRRSRRTSGRRCS